jgi:hypothetical protein
MKQINRRQIKIDLLKGLQAGTININQLIQPIPFGMVIVENNIYHFSNSRTLTEEDFKKFLFLYPETDKMNIYGMIIK